MGGAASIEHMKHMSVEDLYRTAKEAGVNESVREKIREEAISGPVALEYADLENDELTDLSKEIFPRAVVPRGHMKAALN